MSLLKQLLLSVTVAIVLILAGTLVFSIDGARQYLNDQLQAQSENAASSLALSLSQPGNQDPALRELLIIALYDSGQFQAIKLTGPDGKVMAERQMEEISGAGVAPQWFSKLLPLATPTATRHVTDGWRQVGELSITSDDLSARDSLWGSTVRVFGLVVGAGLLWALFAVLLIRWLKRALNEEITEQVRAIAEGDAAPEPKHRRVAELAQASRMILNVRQKVQASSQEQNARIESLEIELNQDTITGLANRKYFMNELRRALVDVDGQENETGYVLLFRQRDLTEVNASMTRVAVDSWLRTMGQRITGLVTDFSEAKVQFARLNGSDFALLIPASQGPATTRLVQQVQQELDVLRVRLNDGGMCRWAFGLTDYSRGTDLSAVMTRLDDALMAGESAGHSEVEFIAQANHTPSRGAVGSGEAAWRTLLIEALADDRLALSVQRAAYEGDTQEDRYESSLILYEEDKIGDPLSGFLFMPAAVRLGLSADCDLRAIELGLAWLKANTGDLVIRVSLPSLLNPKFLPDTQERLKGVDTTLEFTRRLTLEIDAHGLASAPAEVQAFCQGIVEAGANVGLRRLAQQFDAMVHLHSVVLSYVKLGGDFVKYLLASPGGVQLMVAVTETAIGLGMKVYVEDIPDHPTRLMLQEYGALPKL
ncbi:EAL domain-containing protein [Alcaligenaceae bacterium]|nr:EAL domain-containing protein [Alcaligenaceae bacterium]